MRNESDDRRTVVGLDIGTTKICAVAATIDSENTIEIVGVGHAVSEGLTKGVITDIRSAVKSITKAIRECQLKSGIEIDTVYAGIAGHHIQGINSEGVVAVNGPSISDSDIQRVIESARAFNSPDKEILHTLTQEYIVDGQDGVKDPIGMAGKRLQAMVHIVLGSVTSATNIIQCCNETGLNVNNIVLEPLASSLAVLEKEEKDLGVILLDIGGGTTDMVIYNKGSIVHTSVLPIGGNQVTNDISIGLKTPKAEALRLKHTHGTARTSSVKEGEVMNVSGISGRADRIVEKGLLAQVIEARFREIFQLINKEINSSGYGSLCATGVVLTGGSSLLTGIDSLAEEIIQMPVRIGRPLHVEGLDEMVNSPMFATSVGLIKYGAQNEEETVFLKNANPDNVFSNVMSSMKGIINNFF